MNNYNTLRDAANLVTDVMYVIEELEERAEKGCDMELLLREAERNALRWESKYRHLVRTIQDIIRQQEGV